MTCEATWANLEPMKRHSNAILVGYGVHAMFTAAGNLVECRFCRHNDGGHCLEHDEEVEPGSRCFANFEREVGTDD